MRQYVDDGTEIVVEKACFELGEDNTLTYKGLWPNCRMAVWSNGLEQWIEVQYDEAGRLFYVTE